MQANALMPSLSRFVSTARLVRGLLDARVRGRPVLLSHLVTCRCPCRCETCLWRGLVADEMTAAEISHFYQDAARAGIRINSIWGGEPLVREDLPDILRASRAAGLWTVLITSGYRLIERLDELTPWLDTVILSLDHPSPRHDDLRGMPGLFAAIGETIRRLQRRPRGPRVAINSVISRLNEEVVPQLAEWARAMSVPIYFHPIEVGLPGRAETAAIKQPLAVDEPKLSALFRHLVALKARGYPISNSDNYLRTFTNGKRPYRCHARKLCLQLRPNGDLVDCLDRFCPVANVREVPLGELLARPGIRRRRLMEVNCHLCNNANVIDTSYLWELRPESVLSLVRVQLWRPPVIEGAA